MLGPFNHPKHSNISLDLAVTITQEACWEFSDSFLEFPIVNPMDCIVIGETPQCHSFMDP
jgi:hypothetical protein